MKQRVKTVILLISLFLANSGWVSQVNAICGNQGNDVLIISANVSKEKEFLFLNIQADETKINPIFSCEFLLKYDADVVQFVEYQPRQDWLKNVSKEKGKIKIIQSTAYQYNYWLIGEKFYLGTFKFKVIKKTSSAEFFFENPIVIEIEWSSNNPKLNEHLCWPKRIRITF